MVMMMKKQKWGNKEKMERKGNGDLGLEYVSDWGSGFGLQLDLDRVSNLGLKLGVAGFEGESCPTCASE